MQPALHSRLAAPRPDAPPGVLACLERHARASPDAAAYRFLSDGAEMVAKLTYGDLRHRALALAGNLAARGLAGQPVLLVYPSGLEFLVAFFACLYSGAIAVPANMARNAHQFARLELLAADAGAAVALTTGAYAGVLRRGLDRQIETIDCTAGAGVATSTLPRAPDDEQVAYLQYTSGSTAEPKGVVVTHGQLAANLDAIIASADLPPGCVVGSWLPQFHDMGLVGTMLVPLVLGGQAVFMQPLHFLHRPRRWLDMLTTYRVQATAAPNFALALCCQAVAEEDLAGIDLSALRALFCGAEFIQAATLAAFAARFKPAGLAPTALLPCYGLAEATLMVAGGPPQPPATLHVQRESLARPTLQARAATDPAATALVRCGRPVPGHTVLIVDPLTRAVRQGLASGEIWVAGPSVARRYWGRAADPALLAFTACGHGPFLRTGDLGVMCEGQLVPLGRVKDLLIIRGRNFLPQDIEEVAEAALRAHGAAAVAACQPGEREGGGLVLLVEAARRPGPPLDAAAALALLRQPLLDTFGLGIEDLAVLKPAGLPRTSSGKLQRNRCAELYMARRPSHVFPGSNDAS